MPGRQKYEQIAAELGDIGEVYDRLQDSYKLFSKLYRAYNEIDPNHSALTATESLDIKGHYEVIQNGD